MTRRSAAIVTDSAPLLTSRTKLGLGLHQGFPSGECRIITRHTNDTSWNNDGNKDGVISLTPEGRLDELFDQEESGARGNEGVPDSQALTRHIVGFDPRCRVSPGCYFLLTTRRLVRARKGVLKLVENIITI